MGLFPVVIPSTGGAAVISDGPYIKVGRNLNDVTAASFPGGIAVGLWDGDGPIFRYDFDIPADWDVGDHVSVVGYVQIQGVDVYDVLKQFRLVPVPPPDPTAAVVTPAAAVGQTTGYLVCYSQAGVVEQNVNISYRMVASTNTGESYDGATRTVASLANGLAEFPNMVKNATYEFWRGTNTNRHRVTIPLAAGTTYALPAVIGSP
jgi:hypothetical protein